MLLNIKFSNQDITEVAHFLFDVGAGWLISWTIISCSPGVSLIVTNSNWFLHHDDKNNMFLCSGRLMDIAGDVIFAGLYRDWQGMI